MAIKVRDFEVRLTRNKEERKQARQLRYEIFIVEEGATATEEQHALREEYDAYDRFATYMGVFHNGKMVGTYRIIDRAAAEKMDGFYSETEYNITKIKNVRGNIAEMSRACVAREYRDNALVMRLLWAGLAEYLVKNKVVAMFGMASWVGKHPVESAQAISYLYYNHLSPLSLRATVLADDFPAGVNPKLSRMNILPKAFVDEEMAKKQMTPLIKGYLRLGATFGKGVFVDPAFNSYEIFVLLQSKNIAATYQKHFLGSENALDHLEIGKHPIHMFGKLLALPFTGSFAVFKSIAQFFLRDDADDAEIVEDEKEEEKE